MSALRTLSPAGPGIAGPQVGFCSHCGTAPKVELDIAPRVCGDCGMGLLLRTPAAVAPAAGEPFVVVEATLTVGAVSRGAEQFLAVDEADAINRPLDELLVAAEAEDSGPTLATAIMWAARGDAAAREVFVRPANTFGVRCRARIGPCGPPSAAVLVLTDT